MVSKNNRKLLAYKNDKRNNHYGLRKLSIGVASVLLSWTLYGMTSVNADEATSTASSPATTATTSSQSSTATTSSQATAATTATSSAASDASLQSSAATTSSQTTAAKTTSSQATSAKTTADATSSSVASSDDATKTSQVAATQKTSAANAATTNSQATAASDTTAASTQSSATDSNSQSSAASTTKDNRSSQSSATSATTKSSDVSDAKEDSSTQTSASDAKADNSSQKVASETKADISTQSNDTSATPAASAQNVASQATTTQVRAVNDGVNVADFDYTVNDGDVTITGYHGTLSDGKLVLPNAQDFIDGGVITAGKHAIIYDTTLWHIIWDKHSQDLRELDVSDNGNAKLILKNGEEGITNSPFSNDLSLSGDQTYSTAGRYNAIEKMDLSHLDVSNIQDFSCMFYKAEALKQLNVANWDVSNGTNFSNMFNFDTNLTSLDVSGWDVSNGTDFSTMFAQDGKLQTLDLSNWNVSKGTSFNSMFYNMPNVGLLDLSKWQINPEADVQYMFGNTTAVIKTASDDAVLNNSNAGTMLADVTAKPVKVVVEHIGIPENPTTQTNYFVTASQIAAATAKVQAKINGYDRFFSRYEDLVNEVTTADKNDANLGTAIKAMLLLGQLADADSNVNVAPGYQYTGLSTTADDDNVKSLLGATYTFNVMPVDEEWTKTGETMTYTYEYRTWYQYDAGPKIKSPHDSLVYTKPLPDVDAGKADWLNGTTPINTRIGKIVLDKYTSDWGHTQWRVDPDLSSGRLDNQVTQKDGYTIHYATSNVTDDQLSQALQNKYANKLTTILGNVYPASETSTPTTDVTIAGPTIPNDGIVDPDSLSNRIVDVYYVANTVPVTVSFVDAATNKNVAKVELVPGTVGWTYAQNSINGYVPAGYHFSEKVGNPIPGYDINAAAQNPSGYYVQVRVLPDNHDFMYYVDQDQNMQDLNPFAKTTVADPDHLTDAEKQQVITAITTANADKHIDTVTVGDDGTTTLTFADKTQKELTPDQTIVATTSGDALTWDDAQADGAKMPSKMTVSDPDHLTDAEKQAVTTAVKTANPDTVTDVEVKDNGRTIVTFSDGSQKELTPDQTISAATSGDALTWDDAQADAAKMPSKTTVSDPDHLTDAEKQAVTTAVKTANPDTVTDVEVKDNGRTIVTFSDGSQKELTPDQTISAATTTTPQPSGEPTQQPTTTPATSQPSGEPTQQPTTTPATPQPTTDVEPVSPVTGKDKEGTGDTTAETPSTAETSESSAGAPSAATPTANKAQAQVTNNQAATANKPQTQNQAAGQAQKQMTSSQAAKASAKGALTNVKPTAASAFPATGQKDNQLLAWLGVALLVLTFGQFGWKQKRQ